MARMALVAVLLLALVPTLGRLAEQRTEGVGAYWAAICTMTGLKYVDLSQGGIADQSPVPKPSQPDSHPGMDCDYCPLLAAVMVLALWLALAFPFAGNAFVPLRPMLARRRQVHPCGLGSRGPPLAL